MRLPAAVVVSVFLTSCWWNNREVQSAVVSRRAEFDFNCKSVEVSHISGDLYGVSGCGKRAIYNANGKCSRESNCEAERERDAPPAN